MGLRRCTVHCRSEDLRSDARHSGNNQAQQSRSVTLALEGCEQVDPEGWLAGSAKTSSSGVRESFASKNRSNT